MPPRPVPAPAAASAPAPAPAAAPTTRPQPQSQPAAEKEPPKKGGLLAATGSIAIATLISRMTGFLKQLLLLTALGPAVASAFTVASQIPNMISELVLGAVLTAIVVPVLVRAEQEDPDQGAAFVRRLFTAALALLGTATLFATAAAPILTTYVFLPKDGEVNTELTTALVFLLLPAILFYGLSALLTAILNTRQVFKPGAWAPVLNNLVVLGILVAYWLLPGEISLDPVSISDPHVLLLGLGVTAGVVTQAVSLVPAIRKQGISLRPLWGVDDRLKQFGGMAVAIVLYVLISQLGMMFATRISAHADEAGPAIYSNAWLLLQLPYGVLGVTVLTAIMPRLSRNAAADDTPAVVDDLSVATRLTMIALIPVITFFTFAGPQIGHALYGYGNFGAGNAERLGEAVSWSAFTLIPYSLVLIHLRVFYAREQAWTPTWIVLGITGVKIALSALAPVLSSDSQQVVVLLGVANGLAYVAGAFIGGFLLHRSLGDLRMANVGKTVWVVLLASAAGAVSMFAADTLLGLDRLSESFGGPGAMIRVAITGVLMMVVTFVLMWLAKVPEVVAITVAVQRRIPGLRGRAATEPDEAPTTLAYEPDTELIPVIRDLPRALDRPDGLPYPGRSEAYVGGDYIPDEFIEGARVSDDDGADKKSGTATDVEDGTTKVADTAAGDTTDEQSATPPAPDETDESESAAATSAAEDAARERERRRRRDPNIDTGVFPIFSPQMPPLRVTGAVPEPRRLRGPQLIPGASVAGGRYRLLAPHGGARGLQFWQALDIKLDREVALTFVDADQRAEGPAATGPDGPQAILSRTLRLGRINSPGLARVLDVVRGSSGGIVVAEWTPGRSLKEMAETEPSPIGAARAVRALAAAAEAAHRGGSALSIDDPDRIRISTAGDAVMAFPGTLSDADPAADVKGLGAMLYALITARWPLNDTFTDSAEDDMRPADRDASGRAVEPRAIRPEVPFEISAVAVRALGGDSGIRAAATVQHILDQATVVDQKTDLMPALRLGQRAPGSDSHALADPEAVAAEKQKSNRTLIALVSLGALTVLVLALIGWWLANLLTGGSSDEPLTNQNLGLTTSAEASEAPAAPTSVPPPASGPVKPASAAVFSPQGTPDNAANAGLAIDGNPATVWSTDAYFQPFPALKPGVGLMVTLPEAAKLTSMQITSPSAGTQVEIRTAPAPNTSLDQTRVIGTATLKNGVTDIPLTSDSATKNVLVWITDLSTTGGKNQSGIAEVSFTAAS
ncbi:murein biosynthesis integral membrane protein MurJ [Prescottella agglutinans]|uniref:Murein biosynthesis integral membrane protein MurJ n=2 Tax=Prescottella agglutinans TaxID=1644129 RepID=A0A3S3BS12_9NOCA|nr:murein biosynthesis integral membrane protein MurJ [Prescottella agglutinans]